MRNGLRQQVVVFICSALLAMSAFAQVDCSTVAAPSASNFGPYCDGSTVALSTPEVTGATYFWSGPNGFASTDREPTLANATAANSGMYFVTVTVDGCTPQQGSTNVVVNAPPPTTTVYARSYITTNTSGTATGPAGLSNYSWSVAGGTANGATDGQTVNFTAGAPGTLTLNFGATDPATGCSATNSTAVTVYPVPTISINNVVAKAPPKGMTTTFDFHITLNYPSSRTVTVVYYTSAQTAVGNVDYVPSWGTITFPPGTREETESIIVKGTGARQQKQFLFILTQPTNAIAIVNGYPARGTGVINP